MRRRGAYRVHAERRAQDGEPHGLQAADKVNKPPTFTVGGLFYAERRNNQGMHYCYVVLRVKRNMLMQVRIWVFRGLCSGRAGKHKVNCIKVLASQIKHACKDSLTDISLVRF